MLWGEKNVFLSDSNLAVYYSDFKDDFVHCDSKSIRILVLFHYNLYILLNFLYVRFAA